ncbi:MAG: 50S ribosomal protein L10 [Acidimicrobiia bacterium]|jgi:large subunit ribosomal protein L10|nr:50S ribosomal protein L10 [Acidimicrobiia bacterium]MDQ3390929.1 50S ribosomal protein L10 [Actinomycetota bacterium]
MTNNDVTHDEVTNDESTNDEFARQPRADKVAVVEEIGEKLSQAGAVFVSEYRGVTVPQMAELRGALREAGAQHKIYKNTLAGFAVRNSGLDQLAELLAGPVALTFTGDDTVAAAKALSDAAKRNPLVVLKGGILDGALLSSDDLRALASLPTRDELLARLAGGLQAPLVKTAGLLQALPRNLAYGLSALIDQQAAA